MAAATCGRPGKQGTSILTHSGTANIVNFKRNYQESESQSEEKGKLDTLAALLHKLTELQCELAQQYYNTHGHFSKLYQNIVTGEDEFVHFRAIGMSQLLHNPAPSLNYGGQGAGKAQQLGCDLLYKVFKGDTRLVRSLLQANGFEHTEGHDWNLLWASGNCKHYLYEGLNEWQKINHFPSSSELTRKDKLAINVRRMQ